MNVLTLIYWITKQLSLLNFYDIKNVTLNNEHKSNQLNILIEGN